jgi:hypothetical protein
MNQENDELDRYSEELLSHVRDLLTVSDPEAEGRLFNGSIGWNLSPEPGGAADRTVAAVRSAARWVLANCKHNYAPIIPEDYLFVELESRIQRYAYKTLSPGVKSYGLFVAGLFSIVGSSAGGLFWSDMALWIGLVLAGAYSILITLLPLVFRLINGQSNNSEHVSSEVASKGRYVIPDSGLNLDPVFLLAVLFAVTLGGLYWSGDVWSENLMWGGLALGGMMLFTGLPVFVRKLIPFLFVRAYVRNLDRVLASRKIAS